MAGCDGVKEPEPVDDGSTLSPDATPAPTQMPVVSDEPTNSPIEKGKIALTLNEPGRLDSSHPSHIVTFVCIT